MDGDRTARPWLRTKATDSYPAFSPDGQWLAYSSNESGRPEVCVQPVATTGEKWLVSTSGGTQPVWSRDGREFFYRRGDEFLAVPVTTRPTFTKRTPTALFKMRLDREDYDVDRNGKFVVVRLTEPTTAAELRVVVNWFDELKRKAPDGR